MSSPAVAPAAGAARPLWSFWAPRHWPVWFALVLVWTLSRLPRRAHRVLGRAFGRCGAALLRSRRRIVRRNLEIAFPDLTPQQRERLVAEHFAELGMSVFDTALAWWGSSRRLQGMLELEGAEHLEEARRQGRGAILVTGHYTMLELSGRLFGERFPVVAIYRETGQPLFDEIMRRGRLRGSHRLVSKRAARQAMHCLRRGEIVWFAIDQTKSRNNSAAVPFFGYPAVTSISPSRMAAATGAATFMLWPQRLPDGRFRIRILPLADFPSADWSADAAHLNRLLEEHVRTVPSQYFWVNRRFKGAADPYGREGRYRRSS